MAIEKIIDIQIKGNVDEAVGSLKSQLKEQSCLSDCNYKNVYYLSICKCNQLNPNYYHYYSKMRILFLNNYSFHLFDSTFKYKI